MSWWTGVNGTLVQYLTQTAPSSASGYAKAGPVAFQGLIVKTDGVNDIAMTVYDSTSAAGTKLTPIGFNIPGNANIWTIAFAIPLMAWNGIWVQRTVAGGGNCYHQVLYDEG